MVWDLRRIVGAVKVLCLTIPVLLFDITFKIVTRELKLRKRPSLGPLIPVTDNMWYVEYFVGPGEIPAQTIIVRNSTGELLLISPMAPTDEAVKLLEPLGKVSLVVVPNAGHDSSSHLWSQRFPSVSSACFEAQRKALLRYKPPRVCTTTCEEALRKWNILAHKVPGLAHSFVEYVLELPLSSGGVALLFPDLIQNHVQHPSFYAWFFCITTGWYGLGIARFFRTVFVRNIGLINTFVKQELAGRPNVQMCIFLHGPPLKGSDCMVAVARSVA